QMLDKPVLTNFGEELGILMEVTANLLGEPYPFVTYIVVRPKGSGDPVYVSWQNITEINGHFICNSTAKQEKPLFSETEVHVKETLLDKQIVDTNGAKVRRVNDLHFLKAQNRLFLVHVDVGFRGLMRRVGLEKPMNRLLHFMFDYDLPDQFISWKFVQPVSSPDLVRLSISQKGLAQIHPADLADIIEDLDIHQRKALFQSLDAETAAEMLEEADPKIQVSLIENIDTAQASDIIEEMSLNEAADLLGDLSQDKAETILEHMEEDVAEDVKELLTHPEEVAGGLMTSSYLSYLPGTTVHEALEHVRRVADDTDFIYYLYVVDERDRLLGMLSIRRLLSAPREMRLAKLMEPRVITVQLHEKPRAIIEHFAKYSMMAIPVVDREHRIKGVIPFKNVMELVLPGAET
ncbi:MAG: CBS domain-containing protein, partial [Syntrophales bacterium LBB04]|nr:CBS domain-containing protein [Syntrophales bacterium LBB04]